MKFLDFFFPKNPYPKTVEEILDDNIVYPEEVIEALTAFKKDRPWRGDQKLKFVALNKTLSKIYGIKTPEIFFAESFPACHLANGMHKMIVLSPERDGKFSVHVFLHEFGHAILGRSEKKVCRWATNLFRKVFPEAYNKLTHKGHLLYKNE